MITLAAAVLLLLLHAPGGREIRINPQHIAHMHASVPKQPNQYLTNEARCLINMTDGKYVSVIERCDEIQGLIDRLQKGGHDDK